MLYLLCNSYAFSFVFTECIHVSQTAARGLDGRHIHNSLRGPWEKSPLPIMICSGSDKAFPGFCLSAENFRTKKEKELGWMCGTHLQPLILDSLKSGASGYDINLTPRPRVEPAWFLLQPTINAPHNGACEHARQIHPQCFSTLPLLLYDSYYLLYPRNRRPPSNFPSCSSLCVV